jgi:hypothetical protein
MDLFSHPAAISICCGFFLISQLKSGRDSLLLNSQLMLFYAYQFESGLAFLAKTLPRFLFTIVIN